MENTTNALAAFGSLIETKFLGMERVSRGIGLGMVANQHILLVGGPGEAKTHLALELLGKLDPSGSDTFVGAGYRGAGEEQLTGFLNAGKLQQGIYEYLDGASLLNRKFVLFDEIDKVTATTMHVLLMPMQNRRFARAGIDRKLPLDTIVACGNDVPIERPVRDRFGVQIPVEMAGEHQIELVTKAFNGEFGQHQVKGQHVVWETIVLLRTIAEQLLPTEEAIAVTTAIMAAFGLTPRRVVQNLIPMAKASAAVNGRAQVEAEDVVEAAGYVATAESTPLVSGAVKDVMERAAKAAAEKTANGRFKRLNGEYRMLQAKFGSTRSFKAKVRITNQALALLAQMAEVSGKNHDSALKDWQDTQDGLIRDFMNRTLAEAVTKEEDGAE